MRKCRYRIFGFLICLLYSFPSIGYADENIISCFRWPYFDDSDYATVDCTTTITMPIQITRVDINRGNCLADPSVIDEIIEPITQQQRMGAPNFGTDMALAYNYGEIFRKKIREIKQKYTWWNREYNYGDGFSILAHCRNILELNLHVYANSATQVLKITFPLNAR